MSVCVRFHRTVRGMVGGQKCEPEAVPGKGKMVGWGGPVLAEGPSPTQSEEERVLAQAAVLT